MSTYHKVDTYERAQKSIIAPPNLRHRRDGRCLYDPEAERELVNICLRPGLSVTKVALEFGINANLLRKWIGLYRKTGNPNLDRPLTLPAFVSVQSLSAEKLVESIHNTELPNGVKR